MNKIKALCIGISLCSISLNAQNTWNGSTTTTTTTHNYHYHHNHNYSCSDDNRPAKCIGFCICWLLQFYPPHTASDCSECWFEHLAEVENYCAGHTELGKDMQVSERQACGFAHRHVQNLCCCEDSADWHKARVSRHQI